MHKSFIALALSFWWLGGCASTQSGLSIATTTTGGAFEQIPAELLKPDGAGPFPAVVVMHDCSGLGSRSSGAPTVGEKNSWSEAMSLSFLIASPRGATLLASAPTPHRAEQKSVPFGESATRTRPSPMSGRCNVSMDLGWVSWVAHTAERRRWRRW